jgi:hypothetical protein
MRRRHRVLTALLAIAALVFAQLAAAAYACPMLSSPVATAMAEMPCDLEQVGNANLCDNHCKYGSASFDSAKSIAASPLAVDSGLRMPALHDVAMRFRSIPSPDIAPAASPPLSRFTVLRI